MTATAIKTALKNAERDYWRFDRNRDINTRRRQVTEMYNLGRAPADIAAAIGIPDRQVHRIIASPDWNNGPENPAGTDLSRQHAAELEELAEIALDLACRLRDEDPRIVWDTITALTDTQLREFVVVLLAAIPTNQTKNSLYAWVYDLAETDQQ